MAAPEALIKRWWSWATEAPSTARWRFRIKTATNWIFASAIFSIIALLAQVAGSEGRWIVEAIAATVLFLLVFFLWDKRAIKLRCPECRRILRSNTAWSCPVNHCKNEHPDLFPFVDKCEHCGNEPKAYKCHHPGCGELIFLCDDRQTGSYAVRLRPLTPMSQEVIVVRQKQEIAVKSNEIEIAGLENRLGEIQEQREARKPKSPHEQVRERISRRHEANMAADDVADELLAEAERKYKDDPDKLDKAKSSIERSASEDI